MEYWTGPLATFDLETTGVDTRNARIVTACIAVLDAAGTVLERHDWLADPGIEIPAQASAVHGITTARARAEGRDATEVVREITERLRELLAAGTALVVYNAPYDLSLLAAECARHGVEPLRDPSPIIDPLVIDQAVDRYRRGKRTLEVTAELYGVPLDGAHDAGADAIAAGRLALALAARYPDDLDIPLTDLHGRQEQWFATRAADYQAYRRRTGDANFWASTSWPLR